VSIYGSGHMMLYVMKRHFLDWRTSVAIHKKVEQVLIQAAMVDLHGVCMGFFPSNSNGISFAAQLHDDTSIELRHQTLHLTRTTSSLMCKPLQFHYGTNSYHSSYLDVTRFIQSFLPSNLNSELSPHHWRTRSSFSPLSSYSPGSNTHRLLCATAHYSDNEILPRLFLFGHDIPLKQAADPDVRCLIHCGH